MTLHPETRLSLIRARQQLWYNRTLSMLINAPTALAHMTPHRGLLQTAT
jgi:hypothetical protein